MGFVAALMDTIPAVSVTTLKPDEAETTGVTVDEIMEEVEERRLRHAEPAMCDCIHVMHDDQLPDMPGATLLRPIGDKITPPYAPCAQVRNPAVNYVRPYVESPAPDNRHFNRFFE